jgi:hypothetical protein
VTWELPGGWPWRQGGISLKKPGFPGACTHSPMLPMHRYASLFWLPVVALVLSACSENSAVAPEDDFDLAGSEPLATVLPELAPEPGTAGTERYVPVLGRIFVRSLRVVREKVGDEAAGKLAAEARSLHQTARAAREAGDETALAEALRKLEGFEARVGLHAFGPGLVRHVHADAAKRLEALLGRIEAAGTAGQDVSRAGARARQVRRDLAAAREAAGNDRLVVALVHAAHALDLVTRIDALL